MMWLFSATFAVLWYFFGPVRAGNIIFALIFTFIAILFVGFFIGFVLPSHFWKGY